MARRCLRPARFCISLSCRQDDPESYVLALGGDSDMAAMRLVTFLKAWVQKSDKGTDDPMYQLAMMALERNQKGDLDYKQVSNLYKLEGRFNDAEYSAIMELFRESHVIEGTATHFYFYKRSELGVWRRIEISFNRL